MTKLWCTWCLKHINGGVALQMVLLLQPPHGARICELLLANAQDGLHVVLEVHLQNHINGGVALQMGLLLQLPNGARICELLLANAQDGMHVVLEEHMQFILFLICPKCIYS